MAASATDSGKGHRKKCHRCTSTGLKAQGLWWVWSQWVKNSKLRARRPAFYCGFIMIGSVTSYTVVISVFRFPHWHSGEDLDQLILKVLSGTKCPWFRHLRKPPLVPNANVYRDKKINKAQSPKIYEMSFLGWRGQGGGVLDLMELSIEPNVLGSSKIHFTGLGMVFWISLTYSQP